MPEYKLISADSHVSEPPDLWSTRVDKKYRERAPQLMVNPPGKEGAYFHYEGYAPHPIGIGLGRSGLGQRPVRGRVQVGRRGRVRRPGRGRR